MPPKIPNRINFHCGYHCNFLHLPYCKEGITPVYSQNKMAVDTLKSHSHSNYIWCSWTLIVGCGMLEAIWKSLLSVKFRFTKGFIKPGITRPQTESIKDCLGSELHTVGIVNRVHRTAGNVTSCIGQIVLFLNSKIEKAKHNIISLRQHSLPNKFSPTFPHLKSYFSILQSFKFQTSRGKVYMVYTILLLQPFDCNLIKGSGHYW